MSCLFGFSSQTYPSSSLVDALVPPSVPFCPMGSLSMPCSIYTSWFYHASSSLHCLQGLKNVMEPLSLKTSNLCAKWQLNISPYLDLEIGTFLMWLIIATDTECRYYNLTNYFNLFFHGLKQSLCFGEPEDEEGKLVSYWEIPSSLGAWEFEVSFTLWLNVIWKQEGST